MVREVVLRDTSRTYIEVVPWFVPRSSGDIETKLKLKRLQKRSEDGSPAGSTSEITLNHDEVAVLHDALHEFLSLAGESEGDYIVIPVGPKPELDVADMAQKMVDILARPGVVDQLAGLALTSDVAVTLHGAARIAELRGAIAELRDHLGSEEYQEVIYQNWCERHSWAFGNAYVARDEVRTIGVGDSVDLLIQSTANGLRDVIELKRPNMPVIRWDGDHKCWYWSREATMAIAQCHRYLDVLHDELRKGLRDHPGIVAYHPRAFVVVGRSNDWSDDQQRALHGLNARIHSITVMTFDHLLAQAEATLDTLTEFRSPDPAATQDVGGNAHRR